MLTYQHAHNIKFIDDLFQHDIKINNDLDWSLWGGGGGIHKKTVQHDATGAGPPLKAGAWAGPPLESGAWAGLPLEAGAWAGPQLEAGTGAAPSLEGTTGAGSPLVAWTGPPL